MVHSFLFHFLLGVFHDHIVFHVLVQGPSLDAQNVFFFLVNQCFEFANVVLVEHHSLLEVAQIATVALQVQFSLLLGHLDSNAHCLALLIEMFLFLNVYLRHLFVLLLDQMDVLCM